MDKPLATNSPTSQKMGGGEFESIVKVLDSDQKNFITNQVKIFLKINEIADSESYKNLSFQELRAILRVMEEIEQSLREPIFKLFYEKFLEMREDFTKELDRKR